MAVYAQQGDFSHHGMLKNEPENNSSQEEPRDHQSGWYFSRKEIEENSPSRRDGIDLKKEAYFRKSYCTFLQDLGMRLKVPQVTIATAIVFCHRFFLRQSHVKNDRRTIATICMFLAGKVEETPRPLKDVILVSYEIIHKKDPSAVQRIKQKEVYEKQKELILFGERLVLATLGFDLNMYHPYKPLVEAIKKFKVAQNALAQVAWNFVNDGLRTSLCLQFKPHHIAAGAIFLAAKFLKVKLPSDGEKVWWQEFDVTPRQLEDVSNQMLELYEQNRMAQVDGSSCAGTSNHHPTGAQAGQQSTDGDRFDSHGSADSKSGVWDHSTDCDGASEAMTTMIDKDKVKAALEKTRKLRNEIVDDDDLIEKELESGIEVAVEDGRRLDKRQVWPKPLHLGQYPLQASMKVKPFDDRRQEEFAEEGELSSLDEHDCVFRKLSSSNEKVSGGRRRADEVRSDLSDREHKRVRAKVD